ncbi:MAG: hydrogenase iron-sulfur subunit [Methanomassiliicoccus sp.]|nr:hydrogenase iron-sulfur subunit [Methanomassiliicoccus sp.]
MNTSNITCFCCQNAWTALQPNGDEELPEGVSVVEIPCSGRIDEVMMLRALRTGSQIVMVIACLEGNCKNRTGNYHARRRVDEARSLLSQLGLDPRRIVMFNLASNQNSYWLEAVKETKELAQALGPIRILEGDR